MPSPKPRPTHLKLLDGNPSRRPINTREPKPVGRLSIAPSWMDEVQREGWDYAIVNAPAGLLTNLDRSVLAIWVTAEAIHADAAQRVAAAGSIVKAKTSGDPVQNPWLAVMNKQALIMLRAVGELGFSPASRTRLEIDGRQEDDQPSKFTARR